MTAGPLLPLPNVGVTLWSAYAVTGKAAGAMNTGDVVATSDSVTWTKEVGPSEAKLKGLVMEDALKTAFVANDIIVVLVIGVGIVVTDATVAPGAPLMSSDATAGQVELAVAGVGDIDTLERVFAKALTVGGAAAKAAAIIGH